MHLTRLTIYNKRILTKFNSCQTLHASKLEQQSNLCFTISPLKHTLNHFRRTSTDITLSRYHLDVLQKSGTSVFELAASDEI